ncbi:EAL domain-containing protein [Granulicella sibirica]|nr:EAL domain-containing protein [Granulicella sibirica]
MTDKLMPTPLHKVVSYDQDVHGALKKSQFVPFFQPVITMHTGQLAGFEVLARWKHPTAGVIPPSQFIALAEQDGWINALTQQILEKAFAAASAIPTPLTLAINISPLQLRDLHLPELVHRIAMECNFSLSRVIVEITESALIDNLQSAATIVAKLKAMGCRLALDDFGTGYSSLHHLQALPFDELKVDRSFVSSMTDSRESRKIVSAVVGLGQSLGLATVAEGIETREQAEMMLWLGCEFGQGEFYGQPVPEHELAASISIDREHFVTDDRSAWRRISASDFEVSPSQRLAQLQAIYDGAPVGLAFVDQNLRYVNLNKRLAEMNGAPVENHLGSQVSEMIPELFPAVEPFIRRALEGEAISDVEAKAPTSGDTRLVSYQPALDEGGEVVGVAIAVTDITERKQTEDALKASEAHYRSMVELNPQVLWIMDPQGRNLDLSPRWDKSTGLMNDHLADHEWLRKIHPEDMRATLKAMAVSRRAGAPIDVAYRVPDGEDGWTWKRAKGAPRFDVSGNIVCWYGSVQDIVAPSDLEKPLPDDAIPVKVKTTIHVTDLSVTATEKERRHRALGELEILDTLPEPEFDDLVVLASEICGTPISLISLLDSERQWFKAAVGLAATETSITSSFCALAIAEKGLFVVEDATKDKRFEQNPLVLGSPHIRFYAGMPLYAGDGVAIGTLCVIDTIPRGLSPGQIKALSILSQEVQGRLELRSERRKNLTEISANRELTTRLEASNKTLTEANGKLENLFAELEETRLLHLADECELRKRSELDDLKNEYVAMVSHELRSPLTSVRGAVGILSAGLAGPVNDKGARLFHIALSNLDRMIRLVNDVLNLERIASGATSLQVQECLIEDLAEQAIETMMPTAQAHGVELHVNAVSQTLGSKLLFHGDPDKILQVLINLLSNAIKFSPPQGDVVLDIRASIDQLTVKISDEGRGIPEDQLEKVFERFRQLEHDDARRLGGSGLGLAICRAIVEQHGGAIWAERNPTKGTSFLVTLPRSTQKLPTEEPAEKAYARAASLARPPLKPFGTDEKSNQATTPVPL